MNREKLNPEEWAQGMDAEAESVSDAAWAAETRWAATRERTRKLRLDLLLTVLLAAVWSVLEALDSVWGVTDTADLSSFTSANWHLYPVWPWLQVLLLTLPVGLILGVRRVNWWLALLLFLLVTRLGGWLTLEIWTDFKLTWWELREILIPNGILAWQVFTLLVGLWIGWRFLGSSSSRTARV